MKALKVAVWGILTLFLVLFFFQNREALLHKITLELVIFGPLQFRSVPIPLYALILLSLFIGVVTTAFYCGFGNLRLRSNLRSLRQQNNRLQEELQSLRNLPITQEEVITSSPAREVAATSEKKDEGADPTKTDVMDD
ncbi:MAG: LapA family protein [Deltaproteobacteria bacterium]|nr:LapA family protein [Deltaproteobacteria bacterium]MBW2070667.1 LapA family protein [Deltaproteobacteria bacterium]